jgi:hypothetical protein
MLKIGLFLMSMVLMPAWAQPRVDPGNSYFRVICIVPMVGSGTWADPKRPMFAPGPTAIGRDRSGILAYYHEPTDDGTAAIVIFVAADRSALQGILTSTSPSVKVFERGKASQQETEAALKAVKKDFNWQRFMLRVQ